LLQRSVGLPQATSPGGEHALRNIGVARHALAASAPAAHAAPPSPPPPPVAPLPPAPLQPMVTYALLPGNWQLPRARYVWVPPETVPRPVEHRPFIPGRYVWRGGEWVWVPAH